MSKNSTFVHPVRLCVGTAAQTHGYVCDLLRAELGSCAGCKTCSFCSTIEQQSYAVTWLTPEKMSYATADVDRILAAVAYMPDAGCKRYFVIEYADCFSLSAANRLLKLLEEPPLGYYFILTTEHLDRILPTIVSRTCVIMCEYVQSLDDDAIYKALIDYEATSFVAYSALVDKHILHESQAVDRAEAVAVEYMRRAQEFFLHDAQALGNRYKNMADAVYQLIKKAPPMAGGAKLFLRTVFLLLKYNHISLKIQT